MNQAKKSLMVASLLAFALSFQAAPVQADPIVGLFNTGVDDTGALLPGGAVDPHYSLVSSADPAFPGLDAVVADPIAAGFWVANSATSQWIAPTANQDAFTAASHPAGSYTYQLVFDLTGLDPDTAQISGSWATDNSGVIFLNDSATANASPGFASLVAFAIASGFNSGVNTLDFVVTNLPAPGANPTGLRVEGITGTADLTIAAIAEPQTYTLMLAGLGLLAFMIRRKKL